MIYMGMTDVQIYVTKLQDYMYFNVFLCLKNFNLKLLRYWKDKPPMPAFALGPKWCFGLSERLSMKSFAKLLVMLTFEFISCDGVQTRGTFSICQYFQTMVQSSLAASSLIRFKNVSNMSSRSHLRSSEKYSVECWPHLKGGDLGLTLKAVRNSQHTGQQDFNIAMSSSFACTQLRPMSLETYVLT
jgi:hypothetical protein